MDAKRVSAKPHMAIGSGVGGAGFFRNDFVLGEGYFMQAKAPESQNLQSRLYPFSGGVGEQFAEVSKRRVAGIFRRSVCSCDSIKPIWRHKQRRTWTSASEKVGSVFCTRWPAARRLASRIADGPSTRLGRRAPDDDHRTRGDERLDQQTQQDASGVMGGPACPIKHPMIVLEVRVIGLGWAFWHHRL